jgi:GntR family transcriptional regulator, sialic acid-inducible nan operon repressor
MNVEQNTDLDAPIMRQKLSDQVFERLWAMVQSGELAPGEAMPSERALMERFKVGRPAVREALQMMANKGLISIAQGERSRVNRITAGIAFDQVDDIAKLLLAAEPSNLDHLKQMRKILEVGAIQLAAQTCTSDDIAGLRSLIEDQRRHLGQDKEFIAADIAFHVAIAKVTGNPLLEAVIRAMLSWLLHYYKPLLHWSGREQTTLLEHTHLVDCLEAHDVSGSGKLMGDHLNRSDPLYDAGNTDNPSDTL